MQSLNQLIKILNNLQTSSEQIGGGSFYFGDPWEFGASNKIVYPFVGCRLVSENINGRMFDTSFNLFFCDLVHKDELNETEVLSDMTRAATRVFSNLKYILENSYTATISETSSFTPFTEKFDDECSGVEVNIVVQQFYDESTCDSTTVNPGNVTIINTLGAPVASIPPGGSYTVEQLQAIIDTITGNTVTIIDPIT